MVWEGAVVQSLIDWGEQSLIDVGEGGGAGINSSKAYKIQT